MTKATQEGRRLRLEVEGIERPFYVSPISANRGRYLTNLFILGALGNLSAAQTEAIFIESFGAENYARATGFFVEQYEDIDDGHQGEWRCTYGSSGRIEGATPRPPLVDVTDDDGNVTAALVGLRYIARMPARDEQFEAEPMRQEEVEALALIAFYWQTVAGMEAVEAFIEEGEGSRGSVKALSLLQFRLGLSRSTTSPNSASASQTQQADTHGTTTPTGGSRVASVPAMKPSQPPARPAKGASFFRH